MDRMRIRGPAAGQPIAPADSERRVCEEMKEVLSGFLAGVRAAVTLP